MKDKNLPIPEKENPDVFKIGDKVTLYFVESEPTETGGNVRQVVTKEFKIVEKHKAIITLENELGFKSSFQYWEFFRRLKPPRKIVNAQHNNVYLFGGHSFL